MEMDHLGSAQDWVPIEVDLLKMRSPPMLSKTYLGPDHFGLLFSYASDEARSSPGQKVMVESYLTGIFGQDWHRAGSVPILFLGSTDGS